MQNKILYSTVPQIFSNSPLTQVTNQTWNHQNPQDCKGLTFLLLPGIPIAVKRSELLPYFWNTSFEPVLCGRLVPTSEGLMKGKWEKNAYYQ